MKRILPYVLFMGLGLFGDVRGEEVKPKLDKKAKHELFYGVSWKKLIVDGVTDPRNVAGFYRDEGLGISREVKLTEKQKAAYAAQYGKTPSIGDWTNVLFGLADEFDNSGNRRAASIAESMGNFCDVVGRLGKWDVDMYLGEKGSWSRYIPRADVSCDAFADKQAKAYVNKKGGFNRVNDKDVACGSRKKKRRKITLKGSVNINGIGVEFRRKR